MVNNANSKDTVQQIISKLNPESFKTNIKDNNISSIELVFGENKKISEKLQFDSSEINSLFEQLTQLENRFNLLNKKAKDLNEESKEVLTQLNLIEKQLSNINKTKTKI